PITHASSLPPSPPRKVMLGYFCSATACQFVAIVLVLPFWCAVVTLARSERHPKRHLSPPSRAGDDTPYLSNRKKGRWLSKCHQLLPPLSPRLLGFGDGVLSPARARGDTSFGHQADDW